MARPLTFGAKEESEIGSFKLFLSKPALSQVLGTIISYTSASSDLQDSAYIRQNLFIFLNTVFAIILNKYRMWVFVILLTNNVEMQILKKKLLLFLGNWYS